MITDAAIPRMANGGVQLCHHCQRAIYFAGGYLEMLTKDLERLTSAARIKKAAEAKQSTA